MCAKCFRDGNIASQTDTEYQKKDSIVLGLFCIQFSCALLLAILWTENLQLKIATAWIKYTLSVCLSLLCLFFFSNEKTDLKCFHRKFRKENLNWHKLTLRQKNEKSSQNKKRFGSFVSPQLDPLESIWILVWHRVCSLLCDIVFKHRKISSVDHVVCQQKHIPSLGRSKLPWSSTYTNTHNTHFVLNSIKLV